MGSVVSEAIASGEGDADERERRKIEKSNEAFKVGMLWSVKKAWP